MNDSDKVKMTINIGGEHIQLSVDFNRQDAVRDAESAAAKLYDTWRLKWPKTPDKELLARVAYQFAYYYLELMARYEAASRMAEDTDKRLSDLLHDDTASL